MGDEFGAGYAPILASQQHVTALGGRTAAQALDEGAPPRLVWQALCEQMDVPPARRLGIDHPPHAQRRD